MPKAISEPTRVATASLSATEKSGPAAMIADVRRRTQHEDHLVFAEITDETMSPRYELGEKAIFNMSMKPTIGDEVFIRRIDGGCLVRRLVGFDGRNLRLLQHTPRLETDLPVGVVSALYPCVTYEPPVHEKAN
jgi:phage repressor protein C with HTH and peptisase S24 domain